MFQTLKLWMISVEFRFYHIKCIIRDGYVNIILYYRNPNKYWIFWCEDMNMCKFPMEYYANYRDAKIMANLMHAHIIGSREDIPK